MSHRPWGPLKQARAQRITKRLVRRQGCHPPEFLLPLRVGEEVSLSGIIEVRVVQGHAEIWGAELRPSLTFQRVVVPNWVALPRIRATKGRHASHPSEEEDVRDFVAKHSWPTVLCIRVPGVSWIGRGGAEAELDPHARLRASLLLPVEVPRLQRHKAWPSLVEKFAAHAGVDPPPLRPPVLLVMGPKGVGKSACCRYFVNSLLTSVPEVCFLETDLGQPEFAPPDLVTLHRVRKPLLAVPHAQQHEHQCAAAFFVGSSTPAVHPTMYLRAVRAAYAAYLDLELEGGLGRLPPLVVNCHGWMTGVGFELVRTIVAVTEPLLIIRLGAPANERLPFSLGRADEAAGAPPGAKRRRTAVSRCGPMALGFEEAAEVDAAFAQSSVLIDIGSATSASSSGSAGQAVIPPTAPELRWMRVASYFRPEWDPCSHPVARPIGEFFGCLNLVRIAMRRVRFGSIASTVVASEVEAMFTGTLVALCEADPASDTDQGCSHGALDPAAAVDGALIPASSELRSADHIRIFSILDEVLPCLAYGFVHSFDSARGDVLVYTTSLAKDLQKVNAILRGDLFWEPHSTRGQKVPTDAASPLQPYCSSWILEGIATGARILSQRTNLRRKRLKSAS